MRTKTKLKLQFLGMVLAVLFLVFLAMWSYGWLFTHYPTAMTWATVTVIGLYGLYWFLTSVDIPGDEEDANEDDKGAV